jgi:Cys-tRNA synthase (O-phospho-L-seryl-tRNA:Cys-tRNA synthase)
MCLICDKVKMVCFACNFVFVVGAICRASKIFFHTDAAQAVGKIPLDVNKSNVDLMSISGHKVYGPKGNVKSHASWLSKW